MIRIETLSQKFVQQISSFEKSSFGIKPIAIFKVTEDTMEQTMAKLSFSFKSKMTTS